MPITDSFTGTDGTGLPAYSAGWAYNDGTGVNLEILGNQVTPAAADAYEYCCERTEPSFQDSHSAKLTMTVVGAAAIGISVRCQGPATEQYYGFYGQVAANSAVVYRSGFGTWTQLGSAGGGFSVSDTIEMSVSGGTTLTPMRNGSLTTPPGVQTDATYVGGKPGVIGSTNGGAAGLTRGDDFECSDTTYNTAPVVLLGF